MIQLELQPEVESRLFQQAQNQGVAVAEYLTSIINEIDLEEANFQEGLADIAAGRTRPAEEVFAELHARYGISG